MAIDAESDGETEKAIQLWEQVNLLAEKGADRQRAVNRIKHLSSNQSAVKYVVKTQSALGTPMEFPVFEVQEKPSSIMPEPQPQNPIDTIPLESEKKVDYRKLRDLLKAGKWEEADEETIDVMLQAANCQSQGFLDTDSLQRFPCRDLWTIDQLWGATSNGHFGFSVQKKIWEECGSPISDGEDWDRFCFSVGWQDSTGAYLYCSDLKKNPFISPKGEFPSMWAVVVSGGVLIEEEFSFLAQRLENCSTHQF
jgi:hypothetical protein